MADRETILKTEINDDPLVRKYSLMTNQEITDDINTLARTVIKAPISVNNLILWSMVGGRYMKIKNKAEDTGASDILRSECYAILKYIDTGVGLDLRISSNSTMVESLASNNVISVADKAALLPYSNLSVSRAEEIGIPKVKLGETERVMKEIKNG